MSHAAVLVALDPCEESAIHDAVTHEMEPFDENGEWFRKGSRWDWWMIGGRFSGRLGDGVDFVRRGDLDLDRHREGVRERRARQWERSLAYNPSDRAMLYDVRPGQTKDDYVQSNNEFSFYSFLRHRRWNERDRMGWFGCSVKTECELEGKAVKRCLCRDRKTGAAIISWGDDPRWCSKFFDRFVRDIEPDCWLVVVDYHV